MPAQTREPLVEANLAIIKFRGAYARWSALHHMNYNEMLVLYTIRESGYCTQKQICTDFLLPAQTIHNVISGMRRAGLLRICEEHCSGHEKAFVLTEAGQAYAQPVMDNLLAVEEDAIAAMGTEKLQAIASLMTAYNEALIHAMQKNL